MRIGSAKARAGALSGIGVDVAVGLGVDVKGAVGVYGMGVAAGGTDVDEAVGGMETDVAATVDGTSATVGGMGAGVTAGAAHAPKHNTPTIRPVIHCSIPWQFIDSAPQRESPKSS